MRFLNTKLLSFCSVVFLCQMCIYVILSQNLFYVCCLPYLFLIVMANPYCREIKIYNTEKYLTEKLKTKLEPNLNNFSLIGKDFKVYITSYLLAKLFKATSNIVKVWRSRYHTYVFHRHINKCSFLRSFEQYLSRY